MDQSSSLSWKKKKKGRPKPLKTAKDTLYEFAGNTTIHGISYIFNTAIVAFERALWFVAVSAFVGLAVYWSLDAWMTWKENPVLTSVKLLCMKYSLDTDRGMNDQCYYGDNE